MLEGRYNYFLAKARSTEVVPKDASRYLGAEPVLTLKDSTGRDVYYYQEDFYVDSLFARSQTAIDKAIALQPSELGYRVDKITALMLYEKGSPDLATAELLKLIQYNKTARPSWTYYGLAVDDDTFVATVQEYCFNFFRFATPGCYEAFRTVSEEMLKIYPKNTDFLSNVGSYWLVYKQKPRQALKWYNKVLKINPKDYTAAKNCVILARSEKNPKLEKKYLPLLMEASDSEAERASCRARLETLGK
jgi:tetratricopeptide (TPR) repeat protein